MRTCKIYCMYDDIAKKSVDIFEATTEEQAIVHIENSLNKTLSMLPKFKYRVNLFSLMEYDPLNVVDNKSCFKLVKTFKGGR